MPKKFYVGIKALIFNDNSVLLLKCQRGDLSYWDLPGGRMEDNETAFDTLIRELKEELPTIENIQIHELVNIYNPPKIFENGEGLWRFFYKVTADFKEIKLSNEHYDYLWVNKDNFSSLEDQAILKTEDSNMIHKLLYNP